MSVRVLVSKVFDVQAIEDVADFQSRGWTVYVAAQDGQHEPSPAVKAARAAAERAAEDISHSVRWIRDQCRLTFAALSAVFCVSPPTAYHWSTGRHSPDAGHSAAIRSLKKKIEDGELKPRQVRAVARDLLKSQSRELSDDEKLEIAFLRQSGAQPREIAEKFNLRFKRVSEIVSEVIGESL